VFAERRAIVVIPRQDVLSRRGDGDEADLPDLAVSLEIREQTDLLIARPEPRIALAVTRPVPPLERRKS